MTRNRNVVILMICFKLVRVKQVQKGRVNVSIAFDATTGLCRIVANPTRVAIVLRVELRFAPINLGHTRFVRSGCTSDRE